MPETLQGNESFLSDQDVRLWLRDTDPGANLLIRDLEFSPEELRTAQTLTVDAWNEEPPILGRYNYTLYNFPFRRMLLIGTASKLLAIAANRFRRNALRYNVPGGAINDQEKHGDYEAAADRLWLEFMDWVRRRKRALNMQSGWATI